MKKIIVISLFMFLCYFPAAAQPGYVYPVVYGDAVYGDGADTLDVNEPFAIDIMLDPEGRTFSGWSTPFMLYGQGGVTTLAGPGNIIPNVPGFFSYGWLYIETESWDGDLTIPDQFCLAGTLIPSPNPDIVHRIVTVELEIAGNPFTEGFFCIDSGDFMDNTYDWLFDPPLPFNEMCWPVKYISVCGDANCDGLVNLLDIISIINYLYSEPPVCDFDMSDVDGGGTINILDANYLIAFLYMDGPAPNCPSE